MPLSARKRSYIMMSLVMGLMGYSIEFQRHTAPSIAATYVVDILGHIYVKLSIQYHGTRLRRDFCFRWFVLPPPTPANIYNTSSCYTARRKEVAIMFVLAEGGT
jgi:hypothetical protein